MASISELYEVANALERSGYSSRRAGRIVNEMIEKAQEKARKAAEKRRNMTDEEREAINERRRAKRQEKNLELYQLIRQATDTVITSTPCTGSVLYERACLEYPGLAGKISSRGFIQRICSDNDNCINSTYRHHVPGLRTILYYKEG